MIETPRIMHAQTHSGKQVGKCGYVTKMGVSIYRRMAIQRSGGEFVAYSFEVPEAQMVLEEAATEAVKGVSTLEEALQFLRDISRCDVRDLDPLKGAQIFKAGNPL
ncbi:hypothetical protein FJV41_22185 [Myxococcus llanfairpwllgwyngyllgogerychwyrndrobwllllantysiliogogogochensis]|uniref:Uncharacterized protein n=1 Tax=Myxococcus llanfairpwllgwyngyllgogerychwyrndrobwllllantysiliogogogochensis TaxID=2590453 RepID=A0A540WXL7_9BACT|nr:hypothetical protein [Myxococcus llanfairpwllgwyngyllgogerychwyrndrobwllllantysiliogogogochensis]TQF13757.1 hypothetical protein FJV41_22185 [Myxococcus llanfairpwllgwyngyllgogerychwyrndrobwllllantysiliogogogochensis]